MGKIFWRVFVIVLLVAAFIPSIAATKTSYIPIIFVSIVSLLFLILELPTKGAFVFIQKLAIRFIFASVIFFTAYALFQQGLSELTTPSIPSRFLLKVIFETFRSFIGPTCMAVVFFVLSIVCVIVGARYLSTGNIIFLAKQQNKAKNKQL